MSYSHRPGGDAVGSGTPKVAATHDTPARPVRDWVHHLQETSLKSHQTLGVVQDQALLGGRWQCAGPRSSGATV